MRGGGDMLGLLKKYPGRAVTIHMKPFSSKTSDVFFDDDFCEVDWDDYFKVCRESAGVRWYIVEYINKDRYPNSPVDALAAAAEWFRAR